MIMPSKDKMYNGRKGIGFENPSYFCKAKDLRPSLYDERVIGLGYTPMFLTHLDEALEIKKFKRARENKIEFAYDYGNLNASYVNEKINFSDDYFQEIINPDFEKIDSPFQQTSSLKPYVPTVILEKIIIDLEDEVVSLLEKEKENLEIIESLKSKGSESSANAISESENQSEHDCHVVEKGCDNLENSKVIAPGMFNINVSQSVLPISAYKMSCASNNVVNKTTRKRRKRTSSKQNDKQVNNDVLHTNRDFVHFSDLDTLSSIRRPKHSSVIWKKKGSSNTSNVDLSSVSHSKLNKDVKRYSRKDLFSCNNSYHIDTRSAYACNDAMNISYNSRLYASCDVNDLFVFDDIVQICLWIINSGCSKHMTGNHALLTNFVEKFLRTVRFSNNDFAVITGYGYVVIGSMTIKKVYYVEGLGHNLFSVGQFCNKGLEVAFRKSTCFVRNEDGVDLLTGDRSSNLYTIALNEIASNSLACLLAKASSSQSWLWHQRLSHLNFATINNLVKNNLVRGLPKMKFEKIICVPLVNKGRFIENITNEASEVIISFIKKTQVNLQLQVQRVRTDNGTEFKNKTLAKFFDEVGISQQFFAVRTPQQNGVVERRNRTLVEAARTMLTFANLPLFLWAEAIATTCFIQNRSIIHKHFDKTPYELINKRKPNIKFFHVFGCRCYLLNDYDDVGKLKAKGGIGVFVGYLKESAAFRVYNKRTRNIHESVNVNFDEILEMASKQFSLEPDLSNLNETRNSSNLTIMKSPTTNVETSNNEIIAHEGEVYVGQPPSFESIGCLSAKNIDPVSCSSTKALKFLELMIKRFEMSMTGEMKFFLGLQVNQFSNGNFINQSKYILDILKRFGMENCDTVPTPMVEQAKLKLDLVGKPVYHTDYRSMIGSLMYLTSSRPDIMFATCLWYPKDSAFDLTAYSDADHLGCHLDRKSTSGSVQFLGDKLVCWSSKKQNCVSISTVEFEYVVVSGCCVQVLLMRTQLTNYGFFYDKVTIYCDSKSAIAISCNPVQHTRTKHIDVRYHFIKDHVEKGTIELYFVGTEFQLADLFTKSLPEARFKFLVEKLGMMSRET
ncbi:retrovirus-related pol polyprotein from transposon TNT 1-94 [Tanacetum coccineum]